MEINGINLAEVNSRISTLKEAERDKLPPSFIQAFEFINQGIDPFNVEDVSLAGRERFLDWAVEQINKWLAVIACDGKEAEVVVMYKLKDGRMSFIKKSFAGLTTLLGHLEIFYFNKRDKEAVELHQQLTNFWDHGHQISDMFGGKEALLPKLPSKKKKDKDDEGTVKDVDELQLQSMGLLKLWASHKNHKIYTETVFNPRPICDVGAAIGPHQLNVWSGFELSRATVNEVHFRKWSCLGFLMNHIRYTWCDSDAQFWYVINWMAHLVQKPWEKMGTSIMVRGPPGSGKSMIWLLLCRIIGTSHSIHIQDMNDLVGDFNACLANKILVFLDEVKFEDGKEMDIFKNMVTGKTIRSHKKFSDAKYEDSFQHIVTSTNRDNFLPADEKDRRVLALNSDIEPLLKHPFYTERVKTKADYFDLLAESLFGVDCVSTTVNGLKAKVEVEEFGLKVFANFLHNYPIPDDFDPRKIPESPLLWEQKRRNLAPVPAFWFNCLKQGFVYANAPFAVTSADIQPNQWLNQVSTEEVWKEFVAQGYTKAASRANKPPKNWNELWTSLQKYLPEKSSISTVYNPALRLSNSMLNLPDLKECQEFFDSQIPGMNFFFELENVRINEGEERAQALHTKTFDRTERVLGVTVVRMAANFPRRSDKDIYDNSDWPVMDYRFFNRRDKQTRNVKIDRKSLKQAAKRQKANPSPRRSPSPKKAEVEVGGFIDDSPTKVSPVKVPTPVKCAHCGNRFTASALPYVFKNGRWVHDPECPDLA